VNELRQILLDTFSPFALVLLANTLLKDEESARNNHVLAGNCSKYSPILIFLTRRLSNKSFLIWLLTTPPHLKYVATLPCNLSLMAFLLTLMFHKVMQQHMQGAGGLLICIYVFNCKFTKKSSSEKN